MTPIVVDRGAAFVLDLDPGRGLVDRDGGVGLHHHRGDDEGEGGAGDAPMLEDGVEAVQDVDGLAAADGRHRQRAAAVRRNHPRPYLLGIEHGCVACSIATCSPGDGLLHGFASGAIAVTPAEAAVAAMAEAALPKKPLNHGTLVLARTKVATVSPGATENVWLTAAILPLSVTSSIR